MARKGGASGPWEQTRKRRKRTGYNKSEIRMAKVRRRSKREKSLTEIK